ncbi:hypothetical protein AKJ37_02435 [candidate division MSBL1 archaeon SCGC-AAA259I09]|uniref:Uncharacterized protein n=1 Tax=candidate division MSBL1 archaeon SCGC-AAA259I09 TaxID=1698267 RepID=A0A133UU49_9EURY|nr:hypothetical protein AKJ37_02435 [candidate division MSBL1 archaeon SCGC-AAA259I09]
MLSSLKKGLKERLKRRSLKMAAKEVKNLKEEPDGANLEKAREQTKSILRKILTADDVVGMKFREGEMSREEASKLCGAFAKVVDGIMLGALKDREMAEGIVPLLQEKIDERKSDPLPYQHFLQMLRYKHRLENDGEVQEATEMAEALDYIKSRLDLDNIQEKKAELEKEMRKADRPRPTKEEQENQMYG